MISSMLMLLSIHSFDGIPSGASEPMLVKLDHQMQASDGSEYWLGKLQAPITYEKDDTSITVKYVVVGPGWAGTSFKAEFTDLRVNLAYVVDESILNDLSLDFNKADYVAFGVGTITKAETEQKSFTQSILGWFK